MFLTGLFSEPSGNKYEHGIKWGLPIVNKDWLMACLAERQIICEKPFLVGDSKVYDESRPMPAPSDPKKSHRTAAGDDHSVESEESEKLDPETTLKEDASPNTSKGKSEVKSPSHHNSLLASLLFLLLQNPVSLS